MESFVVRFKNVLVLSLVILLQVVGLAIQVRRHSPNGPDAGGTRLIRSWVEFIVSPPERLVRATGAGIRGVWNNYFYLRNVRQQNDQLQAEIHRLRLEQAGLLEDARQGERLQNLLAFKKRYIYQTVAAQVIGTSGSLQSHILTIDKGAEDGIRTDMGVITPDGIVGKVRDVFGSTSQVLLINDQSSGAGVVMETTRIRGVLRGNADGQPQIINLLPDSRIQPGEKVLTSGGDQIFPRGLNVGTVDHITRDPDRPTFIDVVIRPNANLAQLEEVLVITASGDTMTAQERKDLAQSQQEALEAKLSASQVLSERLPSAHDPNAPQTAAADATTVPPPPRPAQAIHPDHYSPSTIPPASALRPGQEYSPDRVYARPPSAPVQHAPAPSPAAPAGAESGQATPRALPRPAASAPASESGQLAPRPAPRPAGASGQPTPAQASQLAARPVTRTVPSVAGSAPAQHPGVQAGTAQPGQLSSRPVTRTAPVEGAAAARTAASQAGGLPAQQPARTAPHPIPGTTAADKAGASGGGAPTVRAAGSASPSANSTQPTTRTAARQPAAAGTASHAAANPTGATPGTPRPAATPGAARTSAAGPATAPRTAAAPAGVTPQPRPSTPRPATASSAPAQAAAGTTQHANSGAAAKPPSTSGSAASNGRQAPATRPTSGSAPSQTTYLPGQSPADRARAAQAAHPSAASPAPRQNAAKPPAPKPGAQSQKPFVYHDSYYVRPPANGSDSKPNSGSGATGSNADKPKPAQTAPQPQQ